MSDDLSKKVENNSSMHCQLDIGDFCFRLVFEELSIADSFRDYYRNFLLDDREPDIIVYVDIVHHLPDEYIIPSSLTFTKTVEDKRFSYGSIMNGSLDLNQKLCRISAKEAMLTHAGPRFLEPFLSQLYYTILRDKCSDLSKFIVHASAIVRNGIGLVFSGPSGTGKTTIASLAYPEDIVLNDDAVIIEKRGYGSYVRSTPFGGSFRIKKSGEARLKAIFLLEHSKENRLKRLSKAEFASRFVREIVFSLPLLSMDKKESFSEMLGFCSYLSEIVPAYKLGFRPDRSFWKCIEEENLI